MKPMSYRGLILGGCLVALVCATPTRALALGETIVDVKIRDNNRTSEDTIRAIVGVDIGDEIETDTLELIRERLNNSGLFSDVDVFWEPHKSGARVVVTVREKFPWAPVPTFSRAAGNVSFGAVLVHGNLWGRGKQGVIGGRISNVTSGAVLAYRDPALLGTWMYWEAQGLFRDLQLPEFANTDVFGDNPLRVNKLRSFGLSTRFGVFWWRRVRTEVGWEFAHWNYRGYDWFQGDANQGIPAPIQPGEPGAQDATVGEALVGLKFDFRAREHAIMTGNALSLGLRLGNPTWGSDKKIDYWKAGAEYIHGVRFFRRINWVNEAGVNLGDRLPLWAENWAGGENLRGFQFMRFRGDTQVRFTSEFHFPLFTISQLDFRALVFYDMQALWWRKLDNQRLDGRRFLPGDYVKTGFSPGRDIHNGVGGGLRFFLRSVAVPLVGVDYGYGIEDGAWRVVLIVGA